MNLRLLLFNIYDRIKYKHIIYSYNKILYLIDTNLVDPDNYSTLKKIKSIFTQYNKNKKIINSFDEIHLAWNANKLAIQNCKNNYFDFQSKNNNYIYIRNFLAAKRLRNESLSIYINEIKKKYFINSTSTNFANLINYSIEFISNLRILFPVWFLILILINIKFIFINIKINLKNDKKISKEICYDLRYGELPCKKNQMKRYGASDGLFIDETQEFKKENSLYYDIKNGLTKEQLLKLEKEHEKLHIAGFKLKRIEMNILNLINIFFSNIKIFSCAFFYLPKPKKGFGLTDQVNLLKFFSNYFEIKLSLYNYSFKKYVSFLDYDPIHHVIGQVCKDKKSIFFGIAHSCLQDEGYHKSPVFLSFQHYFIVSDYHSSIHPTWKNNHSLLHKIGPWRSDFIVRYSNNEYYSLKIEKIKKLLSKFSVISLHLPPIDSFIFDDNAMEFWLNTFNKILNANNKIFFILHSRRKQKFPAYYNKIVENMKSTKRALFDYEVDNELNEYYYWANISNLTIGCGLSDVLIEAWAIGMPAACYPGFGKDLNSLEKLGNLICIYNDTEFQNLIDSFLKSEWPSKQIKINLDKAGLYGKGNGKLIDRIKYIISNN